MTASEEYFRVQKKMSEKQVKANNSCPECGTKYSQIHLDRGDYIEYGFCETCIKWFNVWTDEPEILVDWRNS